MIGLRPQELLFLLVVLFVSAVVVAAVLYLIYQVVRLAIRKERNST